MEHIRPPQIPDEIYDPPCPKGFLFSTPPVHHQKKFRPPPEYNRPPPPGNKWLVPK